MNESKEFVRAVEVADFVLERRTKGIVVERTGIDDEMWGGVEVGDINSGDETGNSVEVVN